MIAALSEIFKEGNFMKELYSSPELEIIRLDAEDIITGSGCPVETDPVPIDG